LVKNSVITKNCNLYILYIYIQTQFVNMNTVLCSVSIFRGS
jgi:hypothetical protein